ncbi:formylglycine-generating enzyme family protein [Actomonas aquatica]|uniref:SUMF1/EgtB/PvdO family nonheme iron enzyme n=1 Tax=Actomonas aquatica TaxID=2866162 RepID=A0ABZ1C9W3_9BACT|nr:SUMF1/EgtB/PvdO family nonheme iron enzyme [Opitutus sp. WL0086]WRQ88293.1 SUMF1/EgtB/PvdO family nonheme iron enzyme [Opitutus sp. WL0086]
MKSSLTPLLCSLLLLTTSLAQSDVSIATVEVGSTGNAADSRTGWGAVSYTYHIGTYEVTNAQYTAFLNAKAADDTHGLYHTSMASGGIQRSGSAGSYTYTLNSGWADRPVSLISYFDAMRFCNWLTNGQGTGDTETGVYNGISTDTLRNASAMDNGGFAIATIDEWYKAAYFDPSLNSGTGGYWLYPSQSDSAPSSTDLASNNGANYTPVSDTTPEFGDLRPVGSFANSPSYFGTYDQGGNVWEWTASPTDGIESQEHIRGGSIYFNYDRMAATFGATTRLPGSELDYLGFRLVATSVSPVPEPAAVGLSASLVVGALVCWRRRRSAQSTRSRS